MSSFFFEREEIHCTCFNASPKNAPQIFKNDKKTIKTNLTNQVEKKSVRNASQHGKPKKKSLKKQRNSSLVSSQRDVKQKQNSNLTIQIPNVQPLFSMPQQKNQQRITILNSFQQPLITQIKSQRTRPSHRIQSQKIQINCEPIVFEPNIKSQNPPNFGQNHSSKKIFDDFEYDQQITRQFEKDFMLFKLQMDKVEVQPDERLKKLKNKALQGSKNEKITQNIKLQESRIRYPITQHIIQIQQNDTPNKINTFRNSATNERQKVSVKKSKQKMYPKQIQSEKGSSNGSSSERESVFLGRGFDGLTQKKELFLENEEHAANDTKMNVETTVTQESHIQNSEINTLTEYSHNITSPKSLQNLVRIFGGANKQGVTEKFYKEIGDLKGSKLSSMKKPQYVYVNGGESGSLRLTVGKLPQLIRCSRKAHIVFILCGRESSTFPVQSDVITTRDFWAESTIDQNRELWDDGKPHECKDLIKADKMEYFNKDHERLGYLNFEVTFIRGLFYQGELQGADRIATSKLLPFYKSRCPTYNLYNILDSKLDKPWSFNLIEDLYRDE